MKRNLNTKIILLYAVSFALIVFLLKSLFFSEILNEQNFLHWDAEHYCWIKNYGYKDFRVAFFPMFPMLWKITALNVYGIVMFNATLFLVFFYFLMKEIKATTLEIILYLSIPSFCFFLLPYSEAIFFASSTILLMGLKRKKLALVIIGLLLSTLSRPAFTIFIPALIIVEFLCEKKDRKMFLRVLSYLLTSLFGLLLVGIIQHYYTGKWFDFFEVQKGWGNKLQIPNLPLTSWAGGLVVRLDGAAMLVGTITGIIVCLYVFKVKIIKRITMPKEVVFSLSYIAGITLSVLLFRGGSLFSLNRFVFAAPFIIVAANFYLNQEITFNKKQMTIGFVSVFAFWLLFGSYVHIQALLKYLLLSVYLFLLVVAKANNKTISKASLIIFITINIVFQFIFFIRFLQGDWVG